MEVWRTDKQEETKKYYYHNRQKEMGYLYVFITLTQTILKKKKLTQFAPK